MSIITDVLVTFSRWMRDHLFHISMAMAAAVLIIYGADINKFIKKHVKGYPFTVRLLIFIAVCAVGYSFLTFLLGAILKGFLGSLNNVYLSPVVAILFIVIGVLAERRNSM